MSNKPVEGYTNKWSLLELTVRSRQMHVAFLQILGASAPDWLMAMAGIVAIVISLFALRAAQKTAKAQEETNRRANDANDLSQQAIDIAKKANDISQRALDAELDARKVKVELAVRIGGSAINASVGKYAIHLAVRNRSHFDVELQQIAFRNSGSEFFQSCNPRGFSDAINEDRRRLGDPEHIPGMIRAGGAVDLDMSAQRIKGDSPWVMNAVKYSDPRWANLVSIKILVSNEWFEFRGEEIMGPIREAIAAGSTR